MNQTKKKISRTAQIVGGLLLTLTLGGCFGVNGNFKDVRNNILSKFDSGYSKDIEYGFGSVTMSLAGLFVSFSDDEDAGIASDMLDEISNVQIGIYNRNLSSNNNSNTEMNFKFLKETTDKLIEAGWKSLVRVAEHGNMTAVLIKEDEDNIPENMFVINMADNKLVLVELSGKLGKIIELALKNNGQDLVGNF